MHRTWPVFVVVFAIFTALTAAQGFYGLYALEKTHQQAALIHQEYRTAIVALGRLQTVMNQIGIQIRDEILHPESLADAAPGSSIAPLRAEIDVQMEKLRTTLGKDSPQMYGQLKEELDQYKKLLDLVLQRPPQETPGQTLHFLRIQITPRRLSVFSIAEEADRIGRENLARESSRIEESVEEARQQLNSVFALTLFLAVLSTGFAVAHVRKLEERSEQEHSRLEIAEEELRRLSKELAGALERQRKSISRELHDEVGQTLTALRLGVGSLEHAREQSAESFRERHRDVKALAESALKAVRHLAMGLRPSMLDDLGLGPAIEWQAREFSRHTGIQVAVDWEHEIEKLPEEIRTCLYRVTQEALTNCARHAKASNAIVQLRRSPDAIRLTVEDDGEGFEPGGARKLGMGLIGMEERIKELGGTLSIHSRLYLGTRLEAVIPLPYAKEEHDGEHAHSSG